LYKTLGALAKVHMTLRSFLLINNNNNEMSDIHFNQYFNLLVV